MKIIKRSFLPPKKSSYFLFGPRGVGKSNFLKRFYKESIRVDLLNDGVLLKYLSQPSLLEALVKPLKDGDVVVIDEVQKAPQLLSKVHEIIESDDLPKVQFVLTGSSARKLKKEGVDLLAGRAVLKKMFPFTVVELGDEFSMSKALKYGLVPLIYFSDSPEDTLSTYVGMYLKEEVKQEGLVRNLESFTKFLEVMCFSHAEIVNLSNVSRETAIKRSTIDGYLSILEDLLLGYRIQSFKVKNRKQTVESEKFYYFDVGIFKSLCPQGMLENANQFKGQALEGFVAQNINAWLAYRDKKEKLFFWRTMSGTEVDFIIYGPTKFLAIEVKATTDIKIEHLSGLRSFAEDYPKAETLFLYSGKEEKIIKGIRCMPVEAFLKSLELDRG